jgi:hypothetical protein
MEREQLCSILSWEVRFNAQDVLYIIELKKHFLSVSAMEDRGFFVTFQRGEELVRLEKASPNNAVVVWVKEGTLYRLQGNLVQDLVHDSDILCELWHRRLGHLHYRALSILRGIITSLPEFSIEQ